MDLSRTPPQGTVLLIIVTALLTATTTLIVTGSGRWVLSQLIRPFKFFGNKLWTWIAPRNPFSIALASYRKHVLRSGLSKIENPVGPIAHIPLERGFAPLRLLTEGQAEPLELLKYASFEYRMIVLGGPGTGKTTLMKHLILSVIRRSAEQELVDKIPIFVLLRDLASKRQSVEDAITEAFAAYHFPGAGNFVKSALDQGKMIVILDGLDEVGGSRTFVVEQLQKFCESDDQRERRNRVIVTCRENSYRTQDLRTVIPNIVRVEPFTNHNIRLFLKGWPEYRGRIALALYGELQNAPEIREACRSPLLLSILAGLYLESERFAIPRSRDRFYIAAIDELLVHRPARRTITQLFTREEKLQVLQRIALATLESSRAGEDSEALAHHNLLMFAKEVFQKDFDEKAFVHELVEVNSIIKPTEENVYTFPHRTIQEYLAAREARRTRELDTVLSRFGERHDLFEVLLFYCGVIDNVPLMERVISHFVADDEWEKAGECLLNMREALASGTINKVVAGLYGQVQRADVVTVAEIRRVEIIAALAQRQQSNFESARQIFSETIDLLTARSERGTSALESALSSDPETAMKVIPQLLNHPSAEWQRTAVRLLRDVGKDDALDTLVMVLRDKTGPAQSEAALVIAGMLRTHRNEIRQRATLLPERRDDVVWPLDTYLPGRIALPLVHLLREADAVGNGPIDIGIKALTYKEGDRSGAGRRFLKKWRHVPRDIQLARLFVRIGVLLRTVALSAAVIIGMLGLVLWQAGIFTEQVFVWKAPFGGYAISAKPFINFRMASENVLSELSAKYPPNASGLARILPWNWATEPVLPSNDASLYDHIKKLSQGGSLSSMPAFTNDDAVALIRLNVQPDLVQKLSTAYEEVRRTVKLLPKQYFIIPSQQAFVGAKGWLKWGLPILIIVNFFFYGWKEMRRRGKVAQSESDPELAPLVRATVGTAGGLLPFLWLSAEGFWMPAIALAGAVAVCFILGWLLPRLNWPNNPLRVFVEKFS